MSTDTIQKAEAECPLIRWSESPEGNFILKVDHMGINTNVLVNGNSDLKRGLIAGRFQTVIVEYEDITDTGILIKPVATGIK